MDLLCISPVTDPDIKDKGGRRGHDRMVVGFITTYVISDYHQ